MRNTNPAADLVTKLRRDFRVMDPVFLIVNHDAVTPERETAYVVRALEAMVPLNRWNPDALEMIEEARTLALGGAS